MILEDFSNLNDFGILGLPQTPGNRNTSRAVPDQLLILSRQLWQFPPFKISQLRGSEAGTDTIQVLGGIAQGQE